MNNCDDCKYRYLSFHDALTRLYNKTFFEEELERFSRDYCALTIVLVDIVDMKSVNDKHGHVVGDKHITAAAEIIAGTFNKTDIVARIGGDEFCAITTNGDGIREKMTRLIDDYNTSSPKPIKMALSVGIATSLPCENVRETLRRADEDMYDDKRRKHGKSARRQV